MLRNHDSASALRNQADIKASVVK